MHPLRHRRGALLVLAAVLAGSAVGCLDTESPAASPPDGDGITLELWPSVKSPIADQPAVELEIEELLNSLSLEEKVGQVIQADLDSATPSDVARYRLGSVLLGGNSYPNKDPRASPADWLALADALWEASMQADEGRHPIPVLFGVDAVHGHSKLIGATIFPHNIGLGASGNAELIRRIGEITALELAVTGLDWNFAPTVAVALDDRWGRTFESYSEDPELVSLCAAAMIEGLQGTAGTDDFLAPGRVLATAKHFIGDGGTVGGKDQGDNPASEPELSEIHGAGYVAALEAGVQTIMASFSSWRGVKVHGHRPLLTSVLKTRMGFDGLLVGDWNAHGQLNGCSNDSCALAFNAGIDLFMVPEEWLGLYRATLEQVRSGEISEARLDDAVRRILRVKARAGLRAKRPSERPFAGRTELLGSEAHREVARRAVRESLVLLKNNGRLLPLRPDLEVLVAGDGADNLGKQTGGWTISWQGANNSNADFPGATSIWEGIRRLVESAGGRAVLSSDGDFGETPDVAIVVFGEDPYAEFFGDRPTLDFDADGKTDYRLPQRLRDAGIPVVSIFLSGRPLWVNPELNASDAFVAAWLPGGEGAGIADVIFRSADGSVRHDFIGRLPFSWPRSLDQTVLDRRHPDYDPLFPFGFGLTYGDEVDLPALSEKTATEPPQPASDGHQ